MSCARYDDNILLIIKKKDINNVLNQFFNFDKVLKFTTDTFENSVPHFLDIEICLSGLDIFHEHTQTGKYIYINSYTLWRWKTSWICSLLTRNEKYTLLIILTMKFNSLKDMLLGMVTQEML